MAEENPGKKTLGAGRVVFVSLMDTIKNELDQGYSARAIYQHHQNKFEGILGYGQFCLYVRQLRERVGAGPVIGTSIRKKRSDQSIATLPVQPTHPIAPHSVSPPASPTE